MKYCFIVHYLQCHIFKLYTEFPLLGKQGDIFKLKYETVFFSKQDITYYYCSNDNESSELDLINSILNRIKLEINIATISITNS